MALAGRARHESLSETPLAEAYASLGTCDVPAAAIRDINIVIVNKWICWVFMGVPKKYSDICV
jgi:hypothetical protein